MNFFVEDKDFLNQEEKDYIHNIIYKNPFPLYWNDRTGHLDDNAFLSHTLITRVEKEETGEVVSHFSDFFIKLLVKFCSKHKINFNKVFRGCINVTFTLANKSKKRKGIPHVDHDFPHKQLIIYLNESDGETVILDRKDKPWKKIKPELYKAICFEGPIKHYATTPLKYNRRIICVLTFI